MENSRSVAGVVSVWLVVILWAGCASTYPPVPETFPSTPTVVFGQVRVSLSGPTTRWFVPEIEFVELVNRNTGERIRIEFKARQSLFILPLSEGQYEVTRVQIAEGAFRSIARLSSSFTVQKDQWNYVGSWMISVASPYYDRVVKVHVLSELAKVVGELHTRYPAIRFQDVKNSLVMPPTQETRLYEVMPYPRVKYFRRYPAT